MEGDKLPAGVSAVAPEIGIKKVPSKFIETFLKKTVPGKNLEESSLSVYNFDLEAGPSKIEKKKKYRKKYNLKNATKKAVYKVPKDCLKFEEFYPIHLLWKQYLDRVLGDVGVDKAQLYPKLMRADYHGCYLVVADSKCATLVGQRGLVVQETRNAFKLLSHSDKIVTILKKGSVFAFAFKDKLIKLYGDNLRFQSAERMKVKFKPKQLDRI